MLKNEHNSTTQPKSSAEARVTPEELVAAITRIEARQAQEMEGTIPIGRAVQELSLCISPEEIESEVNQQRAERLSVKSFRAGGKRGFRLLAVAVGMALIAILSVHLGQQTPNKSTLVASPNLLVQDSLGGSKILRTLGEVPNDKPVLCMFDLPSNSGLTSYSEPNDAWILIKHDSKVYLRGWTEQMSDAALQAAGHTTIYDNPPGGSVTYVPITIPLDGIKCVNEQSDMNSVVVTDVHLDKHAYEKW